MGSSHKKSLNDYCLINILEKPNKFFIDDWCDKTFIKENRDKVMLSVNAPSDKFLKETITLNIISLVKTRKVIVRKSGSTNHSNHYFPINNTIHILNLILLPIQDCVFE